MSWQRFNRGTNVFEVSDDNGATWQTLVIAAAGLGTPALPANIAYTNVVNTFAVKQNFGGGSGTGYSTAPIEIVGAATPRVSFHWPGVVASQIGMDSTGTIRTFDNPGTGYEKFACSYIYTSVGQNSLGDITCRGGTNFMSGLYVSAGAIRAVAGTISSDRGYSMTCGWDFFSTAPIYPGRTDTGWTVQSSWYLCGHGSYGLFTNTGFYISGAIWTANHVYVAGNVYEVGRTSAMGHWIDFSPSFWSTGGGVTLHNVYAARYMLIGKTLFIVLNISMTVPAGVILMTIPGGFTPSCHTPGPGWLGAYPIMPHANQNDPSMPFYADGAGNVFAANTNTMRVNMAIPIN